MDRMPTNEEEFRLSLVAELGKIGTAMSEHYGAISTSLAEMNGKLDVTIANHEALEKRVDGAEDSLRSAKNWENIKFLSVGLLQGLAAVLGHAKALPGIFHIGK